MPIPSTPQAPLLPWEKYQEKQPSSKPLPLTPAELEAKAQREAFAKLVDRMLREGDAPWFRQNIELKSRIEYVAGQLGIQTDANESTQDLYARMAQILEGFKTLSQNDPQWRAKALTFRWIALTVLPELADAYPWLKAWINELREQQAIDVYLNFSREMFEGLESIGLLAIQAGAAAGLVLLAPAAGALAARALPGTVVVGGAATATPLGLTIPGIATLGIEAGQITLPGVIASATGMTVFVGGMTLAEEMAPSSMALAAFTMPIPIAAWDFIKGVMLRKSIPEIAGAIRTSFSAPWEDPATLPPPIDTKELTRKLGLGDSKAAAMVVDIIGMMFAGKAAGILDAVIESPGFRAKIAQVPLDVRAKIYDAITTTMTPRELALARNRGSAYVPMPGFPTAPKPETSKQTIDRLVEELKAIGMPPVAIETSITKNPTETIERLTYLKRISQQPVSETLPPPSQLTEQTETTKAATQIRVDIARLQTRLAAVLSQGAFQYQMSRLNAERLSTEAYRDVLKQRVEAAEANAQISKQAKRIRVDGPYEGMTYEEFARQYKEAFAKMNSYKPWQAGREVYSNKMSSLFDFNQEWADRVENESKPQATTILPKPVVSGPPTPKPPAIPQGFTLKDLTEGDRVTLNRKAEGGTENIQGTVTAITSDGKIEVSGDKGYIYSPTTAEIIKVEPQAKPPELMTEAEYQAWEETAKYGTSDFEPAAADGSHGALYGLAAIASKAKLRGRPISADAQRLIDESTQEWKEHLEEVKIRTDKMYASADAILPMKQIKAFDKMYSGQSIAEQKGKLKGIFQYKGKLWANMGGTTIYNNVPYLNAQEIVPKSEYKGESWEYGKEPRETYSYAGTIVHFQGKDYVCIGERLNFTGDIKPEATLFGPPTPKPPAITEAKAPTETEAKAALWTEAKEALRKKIIDLDNELGHPFGTRDDFASLLETDVREIPIKTLEQAHDALMQEAFRISSEKAGVKPQIFRVPTEEAPTQREIRTQIFESNIRQQLLDRGATPEQAEQAVNEYKAHLTGRAPFQWHDLFIFNLNQSQQRPIAERLRQILDATNEGRELTIQEARTQPTEGTTPVLTNPEQLIQWEQIGGTQQTIINGLFTEANAAGKGTEFLDTLELNIVEAREASRLRDTFAMEVYPQKQQIADAIKKTIEWMEQNVPSTPKPLAAKPPDVAPKAPPLTEILTPSEPVVVVGKHGIWPEELSARRNEIWHRAHSWYNRQTGYSLAADWYTRVEDLMREFHKTAARTPQTFDTFTPEYIDKAMDQADAEFAGKAKYERSETSQPPAPPAHEIPAREPREALPPIEVPTTPGTTVTITPAPSSTILPAAPIYGRGARNIFGPPIPQRPWAGKQTPATERPAGQAAHEAPVYGPREVEILPFKISEGQTATITPPTEAPFLPTGKYKPPMPQTPRPVDVAPAHTLPTRTPANLQGKIAVTTTAKKAGKITPARGGTLVPTKPPPRGRGYGLGFPEFPEAAPAGKSQTPDLPKATPRAIWEWIKKNPKQAILVAAALNSTGFIVPWLAKEGVKEQIEMPYAALIRAKDWPLAQKYLADLKAARNTYALAIYGVGWMGPLTFPFYVKALHNLDISIQIYEDQIRQGMSQLTLPERFEVEVLDVVDGDTLKVALKAVDLSTGKSFDLPPESYGDRYAGLRIVGIDAPEMGSKKGPKGSITPAIYEDVSMVQPKYADESTNAIKNLLGKKIIVSTDPDNVIEVRQTGGARILGTLKYDGKDIGLELIKKGLATAWFYKAHNKVDVKAYTDATRTAHDAATGMWSEKYVAPVKKGTTGYRPPTTTKPAMPLPPGMPH